LNYRIEKECSAVTLRKRKFINTDYTQLSNDSRKLDLIVEMRNHELELLLFEIGTNNEDITGRKYRTDHSQLKISLRDCLYTIIERFNLSKADSSNLYTLGIQIIGNEQEFSSKSLINTIKDKNSYFSFILIGSKWFIYSMTYDHESKFYFFNLVRSFNSPTSLYDLEDFLPSLIENLLALRVYV